MKIMTVLGTRPEIIRLCLIIEKLDKLAEHVLVHTGQNYEDSLNKLFFADLKVRKPDYALDIRGASFGEQAGKILAGCEKVMLKEKPNRLLILGDTNSGLSALCAKRLGIPVFHLEAGNRCYDDRVPEEVNRRVIDHASDVWMPYTERSRANLLREGIPGEKTYVIGNPINEVMQHYMRKIDRRGVVKALGVKAGGYLLATAHRAENVDMKERLQQLLRALDGLQKKYGIPVIVSLHPRTKNKLEKFGLKLSNLDVRLLEPFGFLDFVALEKQARCVITDSGTVQEECCILGVPNITIRDTTERPETIECGSNMLTGVSPEAVLNGVELALSEKRTWQPPPEYMTENVSTKVVKIVLGYLKDIP